MPTFTQLASQGNTIITQGRFTSTGSAQTLSIPSGFSWIQVLNETAATQVAADLGAVFTFQVGQAIGQGFVMTKLGTIANDPLTIGQIAAGLGFTPFTSGPITYGPSTATTNISNSPQPNFTVANTTGVTAAGTIVRFDSLTGDGRDMNAYDFLVARTGANNFATVAVLQQSPGAGGAITGNWRIVNLNPLYYPQSRYIVNAQSAGATTVLTFSIPSGYQVGQEVRVLIPRAFTMTQLDGLAGTILEVNDTIAATATLAALSIRLNIDSSGFTAFTWPVGANGSIGTRAMVLPIGIDTATALG